MSTSIARFIVPKETIRKLATLLIWARYVLEQTLRMKHLALSILFTESKPEPLLIVLKLISGLGWLH